jgi:hypothetical protein
MNSRRLIAIPPEGRARLAQANVGRVYDALMSDKAEDDCAICAKWPPALRATMRDAIFRIPFKQPICDDCIVAFWDNVWKRSEARRRLAKGR